MAHVDLHKGGVILVEKVSEGRGGGILGRRSPGYGWVALGTNFVWFVLIHLFNPH